MACNKAKLFWPWCFFFRSAELPVASPPDLADVVASWHHLPEAVKAAIRAMVRASHSEEADSGSPR